VASRRYTRRKNDSSPGPTRARFTLREMRGKNEHISQQQIDDGRLESEHGRDAADAETTVTSRRPQCRDLSLRSPTSRWRQ